MDRKYRVAAYIDCQALRQNLIQMKRKLAEDTMLLAVVKADAYGHGATSVAAAVEDMVDFFAVATADEAIELQEKGIHCPILILGYTHDSYYEELIGRRIRPCVYSFGQAKAMSDAAVSMGQTLYVHIKVDTGMGRLGFLPDEQGIQEVVKIAALPGLEIEGLFTHFAAADEADKTMTRQQIAAYETFVNALKEKGVQVPIHHVANSAAILEGEAAGDENKKPQVHRSAIDSRRMVRAGIAMYGCYPSDEVDTESVFLQPVLSWKSHIVHVKWLKEGATVSYGATYVVQGCRRIATIPVGYGDGYPRSLSNRGHVLICGRPAPICGRICMDQMMVDVTEIPEAEVGTEVTLIGKDGEEEITATALGKLSGRFHYELLCDINQRVPRIYAEGS